MDQKYTSEEILAFLQGERSDKDTKQFWRIVEADERLGMEVASIRVLLEEGRKAKFRRLLKEVKDFDSTLPPIQPD